MSPSRSASSSVCRPSSIVVVSSQRPAEACARSVAEVQAPDYAPGREGGRADEGDGLENGLRVAVGIERAMRGLGDDVIPCLCCR